MSAPVRQRLSADERRTQVVAAAIKRFAVGGMAGTSTEDIAADVGLSQPYLFRLFRTKRDLFLACCAACDARIHATFADADPGEGTVGERLTAMGQAYRALVADRDLLRFQLQMYAASADAVIQEQVRAGYKGIVDDVRARTGASEPEIWAFMATGMLINTTITLGIDELVDKDEWAASWCDPANFAR